jgi:hypothetical protein
VKSLGRGMTRERSDLLVFSCGAPVDLAILNCELHRINLTGVLLACLRVDWVMRGPILGF